MISVPTKLRQLIIYVKQVCQEQLWLASLLVLLLMLATLGVERWSASHRMEENVSRRDQAYVAVHIQLSPEELLRIVSLSLTELLDMEVYTQAGSELLRKDPVMMSMYSDEQQLSTRIQEIIMSNRARRNRTNMLIFKHNCNTNNNEAIAGLT